MRTLLALLLLSLAGAASLAAQDRVILFEASTRASYRVPQGPGTIREIEITDGGRGWSEVVRVEIPSHSARRPVALADGRKIMWLAGDGETLALAQYDRTTYRASVVDVGRFSREAFLVPDRPRARVFVIEPMRIVAIDEQLRPFAVTPPGPMTMRVAAAAGDALVVYRRDPQNGEGDMVVINSHTGAIVRTVVLDPRWEITNMALSRDAQRLYVAYIVGFRQHYLDLYSVNSGERLARASNVQPRAVFELDEARGVVISSQPAPVTGTAYNHSAFQVRDARTLTLLREFGLGFFWQLSRLEMAQTRDAVVFYTHHSISSIFDEGCGSWGPAVTIFERRTLAAVRHIKLQGHCPFLVPLPAQ